MRRSTKPEASFESTNHVFGSATDEGREVAALEADFLDSMFETRKLEAELPAKLAPFLDPQVCILLD